MKNILPSKIVEAEAPIATRTRRRQAAAALVGEGAAGKAAAALVGEGAAGREEEKVGAADHSGEDDGGSTSPLPLWVQVGGSPLYERERTRGKGGFGQVYVGRRVSDGIGDAEVCLLTVPLSIGKASTYKIVDCRPWPALDIQTTVLYGIRVRHV
ncbi:hypothetical protein RHMOL_Rhmol11G0089700 [Rhododendron molle]|uniref:Uncharacterized protein n=1 Tax=Rhododendron molle TaxID=49168 RepID=A0ACC0LQD9_RHOML|nr:hypothetical protein RHMOL_Rhmol11G0089700 [Rhododendron molle]